MPQRLQQLQLLRPYSLVIDATPSPTDDQLDKCWALDLTEYVISLYDYLTDTTFTLLYLRIWSVE
jgi:hypothetical protein